MGITKNDDQVKINSGNDFRVYYNSAWITLGNIVDGNLKRAADKVPIKYNNGYKFDKRASASCSLIVILAQVTKEIFDTIDGILASGRPLYFYNGLDNSVHQEFYFPKANLIENIDLSMAGDKHQTIALEFSVVPQTANVTVTPSTGLPTDAKSHGTATLQTGTNPFYIVLETAA